MKTIKNIILVFCMTLMMFCILDKKENVEAAATWQIEGTTIIAYNGTESTVNVPEGMTKIGPGAFSSNTKLNKVVLPDSVTEIGMRAFAGCTNLADINIENIEKIGEVAFEGTAIQEVVFSDKIVEIPIGCFAYSSVKKVTLGKNVIGISSSAFYECKKLQEINLSDCLLSIGSQAFYRTAELKNIHLPEGLSVIGSKAFEESGLEEINIPGTVSELVAGTFSYCSSLKKITFNEGLEKLGSSLIYETLIKEVYIPSTVKEMGFAPFGFAHQIEKITVDENNEYFDSDNGILYTEGFKKIIMIPYNHPDEVISLHDGVEETEELFAGYLTNVKKIIIPEGLKSLNHNSFSNSKALEEVVLPNSLEIIFSGAFSYCSSLYTITLPENLKELSTSDWWIGVFDSCSSLKEVVIPDSVEKIGPYTFYGCSSLEKVVYPAGVKDFGFSQFKECSNLKEIIVKEGNQFAFTEDGIYFEIIDGVNTLSLYPSKKEGKTYTVPETVTVIGNNAFDSVSNLEEVTIPKTVTSIGTNLFSSTKNLKKVTIDAEITFLPNFTFSYSSVSEVILPETLIEIGRSVFMNTHNLKTITLPSSLKVIGDSCFYNSGLEEIELPDSVTEIGQAFFYATSLKKIKLSNNITTFVASSFNSCQIEEIVIPSSMVEIAEYSFVDCSKLKSVYVPESVATIYANSFYNCKNLIELTISEDNKFFTEEDGILYDAEKTKIVFVNQNRLSEVIVLPDTLEEIGPAIFKDNNIIKEITIPANVKSYGYNALKGAQIEKAIIAEGTKDLPNFLFQDCTKLKEVILPESLEKIDASVFGGCTSLEYMEIADTVNIDSAFSLFRDCVNLKKVKLPSTMKKIPQYMFSGCISLEEIIIPYGVEEVETHFVERCDNIETIIIPETVTGLEYDAFANSSVKKVIFLGDAPTLISSIFGDVFFPSNVNVYVFKNAKGYSDKSYKPYIKQFAYLDNDIFKDESSMEAISVGEHKVILEAETIYASLYKYYVKNENGEFELIKETNEPICEYEAYLGNKTYEFKVDMIIKNDKQEFVTTVFDDVYVSKTQEEYLLDYLILEIISLSYKSNPTYDELKNIFDQYYALSDVYKDVVNKEIDITDLENKYNDQKAYKEDIDKITSIKLSVEKGNELTVGDNTKLNVTFPEGVVNKDFEITLNKVGVIDVKEDGTIYAIKEGSVLIKVTALSGVSEEIEIKVISQPIVDKPKNCSCKSNTLIKYIIATTMIIGGCYILMKRGAKNA